MSKPKVAFYWCASCGGCEESIVDLAEDILGVVAAVDIVLWPVAMDFKRHHVEAMPDGSITATLLNGAIRTSEQEEMARLLRRKTQVLIAYGACAQSGGIPALANQFSREQILKYVYEDSPSTVNPEKTRPQTRFEEEGRVAELPEFRNVVRSLDQVVDVDYYLPGCPPTPKVLKGALEALLSGKLPPKGTILSPDTATCMDCPRLDSKPQDLAIEQFRRPHLTAMDPEKCFLAQGVPCMGSGTRGGCEAQCPKGNMPCTGCFGPTSKVHDQGAKLLSALTSTLAAKDEAGINQALKGIPDPVGTFYRYGLAKSLLRRKVDLQ
ncbi:MAG: oxidoreductase [Elusimicrobiota bacterium]|jgi:F420-non-reducing hydrogenase small subunit